MCHASARSAEKRTKRVALRDEQSTTLTVLDITTTSLTLFEVCRLSYNDKAQENVEKYGSNVVIERPSFSLIYLGTPGWAVCLVPVVHLS